MKKAFIVCMVCSGIIIVTGFVMIFTGQTTPVNLEGRFSFKGEFSGAQVVVAGLLLGLAGFQFKKGIKQRDEKYDAWKKKGY